MSGFLIEWTDKGPEYLDNRCLFNFSVMGPSMSALSQF